MAAVGRIQDTTPPGREMMNHSGRSSPTGCARRGSARSPIRSTTWRCCSWTSTVSSRSTTPSATPPATACSFTSRSGCVGDTAARLGGDEFVVLLDGVGLPHGPRQVCDRIRATFVDPVIVDGEEIHVGVSVGVATSTDRMTDPEDLPRHADAEMYDARHAAR
jgi:hypothetical protein